MRMTISVVHSAGVFSFGLSVEREVSGATQGILHALGMHSSELIREAEIDVITEPGFVRPVASQRVKRFNDVLLASFAVLGH
ncbi:MAG: hypothetical protein WA517_18120 [Candidatus Acidiferrum sp.]